MVEREIFMRYKKIPIFSAWYQLMNGSYAMESEIQAALIWWVGTFLPENWGDHDRSYMLALRNITNKKSTTTKHRNFIKCLLFIPPHYFQRLWHDSKMQWWCITNALCYRSVANVTIDNLQWGYATVQTTVIAQAIIWNSILQFCRRVLCKGAVAIVRIVEDISSFLINVNISLDFCYTEFLFEKVFILLADIGLQNYAECSNATWTRFVWSPKLCFQQYFTIRPV